VLAVTPDTLGDTRWINRLASTHGAGSADASLGREQFMTEAFDYSATAARASPATDPRPPTLAPVEALLVDGGDARIRRDPATGLNQYGCSPRPEERLSDFASSTASSISPRGYAAASALRHRLAARTGAEQPAAAYAHELARIRRELVRLCGLEQIAGLDVILAASGTDLHLLAAALVGGSPERPLLCIDVEPEETGSGVPAALAGRHFSSVTALGESVVQGAPLGAHGEFRAVRARDGDGRLRATADIEAELDAAVHAAAKAGRRALLNLADVSKTGLISPSPETALALARRFPRTLEVMVDACQFRLSPESLRAYLEQGFMVAVTGSKFLTGPTFSGALFVPERVAHRLRSRLLPKGLSAYSARADWPQGWVAGASLPAVANLGLLLRWEAALAELAAFRALPQPEVEGYMRTFARIVRQRLADDPAFELLPTRRLDRGAVGAFTSWDRSATIFPFLLRHTSRGRRGFLSLAETDATYRSLAGVGRTRFGQPVRAGERDDAPVAALRLCNSARLVTEALGPGGDPAAVLSRALTALDRVSRAVDGLPG
jgi:hypothetical protein